MVLVTNTTIATNILFIALALLFLKPCNCTNLSPGNSSLFSAVYAFGGSEMDTGNNNFMNSSTSKADYLPYGIDYDYDIPTGRFCNGKIIPDFISSKFGLKDTIPPFLDPTLSDDELSSGVNFASAGAGFDDLTMSAAKAISLLRQIKLFQTYSRKLSSGIGVVNSKMIISNSLVIANAGSYDFEKYYLHLASSSLNFMARQDLWIINIRNFILQIYTMGCRTVLITGLPPVGCLPSENRLQLKKCTDDQNKVPLSYNAKLIQMLPKLQATLQGSKLIYVDIYKPLVDMMNYPQKYGK